MKTIKLITLVLVTGFFFACGSGESQTDKLTEEQEVNLDKLNEDNLLVEIKKRKKALGEDEEGMENGKGLALMNAYVTYSMRFSNHKDADEYLFKAGEIAMGLNRTSQAINYLDRVYNEYKEFEKRPYALFLKAFVLENQAHNLEEAQIAYELFIEEFPTHEMADDAQYSIKNLGKSPEELIREFEIIDSISNAKAA